MDILVYYLLDNRSYFDKAIRTKPSDVLIIKAAGYVLEFPKEYVYAGNDEDTETYKRTDETAELGFYHDFLDEDSLAYINNNPNEYKYFAEEELAVILDDYLDNTDEVLTGMKYTDEIKSKGSIGNTYHYSMFCEDKSGILYFSWFLNSATGEFAIFSLQDYDPDFKNSEEFLAAISNAVLE